MRRSTKIRRPKIPKKAKLPKKSSNIQEKCIPTKSLNLQGIDLCFEQLFTTNNFLNENISSSIKPSSILVNKEISSIRKKICEIEKEIEKEIEILDEKYINPPSQICNSELSKEIIEVLQKIIQIYKDVLKEINVDNYDNCELYQIVYDDFIIYWPIYVQRYNAAISIHETWISRYSEKYFPFIELTKKLKCAKQFIEEFEEQAEAEKLEKKKAEEAEKIEKKKAEELAKIRHEERKKQIEAKDIIEKYKEAKKIIENLECEKEQKEELVSVRLLIKEKLNRYKNGRI